jgi:exonuclease III
MPTFNNRLVIQEKLNTEMSELKFTIEQVDLTDIYRVFHPRTTEYTFFSAAHELSKNRSHFSPQSNR